VSRVVGRSGDGQCCSGGGWQSSHEAATLSHLWRVPARTRQAGAQAHYPRRPDASPQAQLWLLPHLSGGFFLLDEELDLRPKVGFTPILEESMVRLSTWIPFRPASRELAFFTVVHVAEATVRQVTEHAGAAQARLQGDQVTQLLRERPPSPTGPTLQLMSLDGCYIQMVGGEWREVKTLALGKVEEPVEKQGEQVVHIGELTYFSRMSDSEQFQLRHVPGQVERGTRPHRR
jgi:hypothetical protein